MRGDAWKSVCCLLQMLMCFLICIKVLPAANLIDVQATSPLKLKHGDRLVIVGNTLAERMQYFGNWETLLHSRFPDLELVVRNLGWSADELKIQLRSKGFEDHGHLLTDHKPDVILACFGFNESFKGKQGLPQFEKNLETFIQETTSKSYNGKSPPHLVLVSPIANEQLPDRLGPNVTANNDNLQLYVAAMARIAKQHHVPFVDLFTPTQAAMKSSKSPLTFNGIHLTESGDQFVAGILDQALFGPRPQSAEKVDLDKLRAEVNEKNQQFFYDYRAVNGCYIYGGRKSPYGIINFPVEFKKLRQMVAKRDQRVWSIAQGKPVSETIDDSDTGELPKIETNVNQPIELTSPEESAKHFKLPEGYQIELFASEEQFPDLKKPVQMTFDPQGRLWVATMPSYPHYSPGIAPNDKVLIFEDKNADGQADTCKTFADKLYLPTGLELGHGGLYLAQEPNLLFLKDTDGDDCADTRDLILHGFDSGDSHHAEHTFVWDPGMALYFQEGTFHQSQIETPFGPERCSDAGVFRFDPKTWQFEVFVSYRFANPWGHYFDRWGQDFVADASTGLNYFAAPFSGDTDYPEKHPPMKTFHEKQWRPTSGCELISSRHFPEEVQGDFLVNNNIGFQGTLQYHMREEGSGFAADPVEPLLKSSDPNFRPVDIEFGPDGSLYIVDWYNPLIGHMQHSLRDPNRDTSHGRIWRITHKDRPLIPPAKIAGEPIPQLLDLLKTYEDRTRYRVRIELSARKTDEVMAALEKWIAGLNEQDPEYQHHLLEALWVKQQHHVIDEALLKRLLQSPEPKARAAATRVLCYWRESLPDPLKLLRQQVNDANPRVRLEAVRALSFFDGDQAAQALEIATESKQHSQDYYLEYAFEETKRTLERRLRSDAPATEIVTADPQKSPGAPKTAVNLIDTPITPEEMKRMIADVLEHGDAARGEVVFRRAQLTCFKCHAMEKAGGNVGPDLSAVGLTSPVEFVINSLLNPSLAIKEQYETKQFITDDGLSYQGIVVDRNHQQVKLKDQDGKIVTLRNDSIERERDGKSLMPVGLTKNLKHGEFLDLVRFISELGRPGPFAIPTEPMIHRWRVLKDVPEALASNPPNVNVVGKQLLEIKPEAWSPIYAKVSGALPLADAMEVAFPTASETTKKTEAQPGKTLDPQPMYLYGEVNVSKAGSVELIIDAPPGTVAWLDSTPFVGDAAHKIESALPLGRHKLLLRIPADQFISATATDASVRVTLHKPQGSTAQFEVVGGN